MHKLKLVLASFALAAALPAHADLSVDEGAGIPEPMTMSLMFAGAAVVLGIARRRKPAAFDD